MKRTWFSLVLACLVSASVMGLSPAATATVASKDSAPAISPLEKMTPYVQPSIVYIGTLYSASLYDLTNKQYLNDGKQFSVGAGCTGFVVNTEGYIATAGHCVDPKTIVNQLYAEGAKWALANGYYESKALTLDDVLGFDDYQVVGDKDASKADVDVKVAWSQSTSGTKSEDAKPARVVGLDPASEGDVALLKVEASGLNAIPLAAPSKIAVGKSVVAIGFPGSVDAVTVPDLNPSFQPGSISSVKTAASGVRTVYEISATLSHGMSGGPTVNLEGEVLGVNSFFVADDSQVTNFIRPASQVKEMLASAGVTNKVGPAAVKYRQGLDAFFAGDKETAVTAFKDVLEDQPNNTLAQTYLKKSTALPDPKGSALPLIIGGLLALLVIGGIAGALFLRRKGSPGGADTVMAVPPTPVAPDVETAQAVSVSSVAMPEASAEPETQPVGFSSPTAMGEAFSDSNTTVATAVFCPSCGHKATEGQHFCSQCGTPLI